ncbi:DUF3179 domain-containing protein [Winogradskyella aurantiaca]|uniref:DUF3179 domain-containing protein n=1 Tax=Winogradskyella aurantiaca TaxID=2219558 RepID=UPI000E1E05F7|nr:DUF3179 domain-containing protein [Winogradskyella aurantiaca]
MKLIKYAIVLSLVINFSCSDDSEGIGEQGNQENTESNENPNGGTAGSSEWLIPVNEVRDGGPGKDGIPSIDDPKFSSVASFDSQINDNDLVVALKVGNNVKIYPHFILDYHEIVNDTFSADRLTLSYCPLTGTAFAWESQVGTTFTSFGVSGLLYNANLILYDRETDSNWSQILELCVNGESIGQVPIKHEVIETNWGTIKAMYPNALVLNADTGFSRPYGTYPYGAYLDVDDFFLFTPSIINPQLPNKQRILAVKDGNRAKVYKFSSFEGGRVVKDSFINDRYLIVGNADVMNAFLLSGDQNNLEFNFVHNGSEAFFEDNEGTVWNIFGEAISGPRSGTILQSTNSFMSMWFAVAAFYPDPIIFE